MAPIFELFLTFPDRDYTMAAVHEKSIFPPVKFTLGENTEALIRNGDHLPSTLLPVVGKSIQLMSSLTN
jgi:hypothetical protein